MFFNDAKIPLALATLLLTYFSELLSLVILLPRYTNSLTFSIALLLMVTGCPVLPSTFIVLVNLFLASMLSPICLPSKSRLSVFVWMSMSW